MTREEDLTRIAKKLDKMVSRNNTDGALDLLKELKSFNINLKLLQETRIGMSVNAIRKHCTDEEVITLAKFLIKDWKRLLDSGNNEKASEHKDGPGSERAESPPLSSPSNSHSRRLDINHDLDTDRIPSDTTRKEQLDNEHKPQKIPALEKPVASPLNEPHAAPLKQEKRHEEVKKQRAVERRHHEPGGKRPKHSFDPQVEKTDRKRERHLEEHKVVIKKEEEKRDRHPEVSKKHSSIDDTRKSREEFGHHRERLVEVHKPLFERKSVLDSSILYPSRRPSPPRPVRPPLPAKPIKRPSVDVKKDRKDSKESHKHSHSDVSKPTSPVLKRPSLETKRKLPADPNAPIAPLPLHLHPPPARKDPPDPNAPLPPLPLHLHPPPPMKRPSVDGKKERKESSEAKGSTPKKMPVEVKKERKESSESKVPKKHSGETKRDRVESNGSLKKPSEEVKKEIQRRESSDSKPVHPPKRPSTDAKSDRRESTDSKRSSSPPAKKLSGERRESHGSKTTALSEPPHRKPSTDSNDRKSKGDVPKTPTTPTSPLSPGFGTSGGPMPPHLSTGDSVRDKCVGMIAAALRTDNDYKEFGANCDSMAVEIEDHIYQEIRATDMKYKNRVRSRISNLKDPKNPGLRKNVLAGNIELSRMATMSAEEMASDELKQLRNVLTQEAIREHQMAKTGGTSTDLLQCGKCKKRNCTYNQVQTRSADEPMTTFVLCNECGNRWKFC
ncbi:transcription elongation factor A protein 3 isoform X2 [Eucyclogobius newberryi]|uniref:transcription elongation factor A protein 3 isoform X2 n=1 Tax=Eucyclogobius newberryi TaxID=166745 RepID=UPI003B5944A6